MKNLPLLAAILLMQRATSLSAFSSSIRTRRRYGYISQELLLPPLEKTPNFSYLEFTNGNPDMFGDLPLLYTNDPLKVSRWLSDHVPRLGCTFGFDVESVPDAPWIRQTSERGAATVQLATPDSSLVIHLASLSGKPSLTCKGLLGAVLRDENIIKVGCSIDQDMLELRTKFRNNLEARGRLDLNNLRTPSTSSSPGLKRLCRTILGVALPKSRRIATSDWSRVPLSPTQLAYSARDAWAGAAVAAVLEARDPTTFAPLVLQRRLRDQRTLRDLQQRQKKRKRAKHRLKSILAPYAVLQQYHLPPWQAQLVRELKCVLQENRFEQSEAFDMESLGFAAMAQNYTGY